MTQATEAKRRVAFRKSMRIKQNHDAAELLREFWEYYRFRAQLLGNGKARDILSRANELFHDEGAK